MERKPSLDDTSMEGEYTSKVKRRLLDKALEDGINIHYLTVESPDPGFLDRQIGLEDSRELDEIESQLEAEAKRNNPPAIERASMLVQELRKLSCASDQGNDSIDMLCEDDSNNNLCVCRIIENVENVYDDEIHADDFATILEQAEVKRNRIRELYADYTQMLSRRENETAHKIYRDFCAIVGDWTSDKMSSEQQKLANQSLRYISSITSKLLEDESESTFKRLDEILASA